MNEKYYKTRYVQDTNREPVWKELAKYLQKYISKNAKILDLGAGYCNFINNIDAGEKHALDVANISRFAKKGIILHKRACTNLRCFRSGFFDVVFASNLLEHLGIGDIKKTLGEVRRVLKKRGLLILMQPNYRYSQKEYFDDYTHKTIWTDRSICRLLASHSFEVVDKKPRFMPLSLRSRLPKNPFLVRLYIRSPIKPLAKQMLIVSRKV